MNEKQKPNLQDLSLYYDSLLDEEKRKEVETQLEHGEEEKHLLALFECFDSVLESELSEDRINALLGDNLKGIHERLAQEERHMRRESISLWDWLLMPRNLVAGLAGVLLLFGVFSTFGPMENTQTTIANAIPTSTPQPDTPSDIMDFTTTQNVIVDAAQKQVILSAAGYAKTAFSSSYDYAKDKGKPLGESFKVLPQTADLSVALQAMTSTASTKMEKTGTEELSANERLARAGTRELAIGLGASLLSLISVI